MLQHTTDGFNLCLQGYTKLLKVLGSNLPEFLSNLNSLHSHLLATFPGMMAPSFRCEQVRPLCGLNLFPCATTPGWEFCIHVAPIQVHPALVSSHAPLPLPCPALLQVTGESLELHYYSKRPGLYPLVIGILKGVALIYFDFKISIEIIKGRDCEPPQHCDHEVGMS